MRNLNETAVLNYYLELMERGEVEFLVGRKSHEEAIRSAVIVLRDTNGMNERIHAAKNLWKLLFEAAMSSIDIDKRGYDKLFKYFDEYVNFEELIFASDSFYRDHTLHSLWVYFLGEYLINHKEFEHFFSEMYASEAMYRKMKDLLESLHMNDVFDEVIKVYENMLKVNDCMDAVRCIASITHDLGYPLKKIEKINKCIKGVIPYFSINNYDEFNFSYSEIQQHYITGFIEFLSNMISLNGTNDDVDLEFINQVIELDEFENTLGFKKEGILKLSPEELLKLKKLLRLQPKIRKNISWSWAYSKDFEEYSHGIMSAFLLMRNINAFHDIRFSFIDNNHCDLGFMDYKDIIVKQDILRAVSNHTSENFKITSISDTSQYLTFIDELEEFSRISRANQNREYITEFCTTDIYMEESWFNVDFIFENQSIANLDPQKAFKGRCERFLKLFDLEKLNAGLKIRLRCIGRLPSDSNIYTLEIARKYAKITINEVEKNIPEYLSSKQLYTREEYEAM